jgi:hypothetical protein
MFYKVKKLTSVNGEILASSLTSVNVEIFASKWRSRL